MKSIDVYIVRYVPVLMFIYSGIDIFLANAGRITSGVFLAFGHNLLYAASLFIISLSNSRYHCSWNRGLYAFLIATPFINYADSKAGIFATAEEYLSFFTFFYFTSFLTTLIKAATHYKNGKRKKKWFSKNNKGPFETGDGRRGPML